MKRIARSSFVFFLFYSISTAASAQIFIEGHNPRRGRGASSGLRSEISVSLGSLLWVDGKYTPLPGYSSSQSGFYIIGDPFSLEKYNISFGLNIGYQRYLSELFSVKTILSSTRLYTGLEGRTDLNVEDKSRISQLGVYGSYSLTKNLDHRLQFQWLFGPELIYVNKNVIVKDYVLSEDDIPEDYRHKVSILDGAVVTGLGISLRLTKTLSLFSDGMMGLSLPGGGFKMTNSGFGLKAGW